jgi:electron transfer flavoprotein beta subunit
VKVVVCLKHAADPATAEYDVHTETLLRPDRRLGPVDFVALEQALRLADAEGASVTAVTVGPPAADAVLRQALTYGADAALRVWDDELEGADSFAVARVLAAVAARIAPDVVLLGTRSADDGSGCVGPALAERLGLPFVANVAAVTRAAGDGDGSSDGVVAVRAGDAGWRDEFWTPLPAVLAVDEGLNQPRYVAVLGRTYRRGLGLPIEVVTPAGLGLAAADLAPSIVTLAIGQPKPRTKVGAKVTGLSMKEKLSLMRGQSGKKEKELFAGPPDEAARLVLDKLEEWL